MIQCLLACEPSRLTLHPRCIRRSDYRAWLSRRRIKRHSIHIARPNTSPLHPPLSCLHSAHEVSKARDHVFEGMHSEEQGAAVHCPATDTAAATDAGRTHRFILLSSQKSGTSWLVERLGTHPATVRKTVLCLPVGREVARACTLRSTAYCSTTRHQRKPPPS